MEKHFAPYEESSELQKLGLHEPCFKIYKQLLKHEWFDFRSAENVIFNGDEKIILSDRITDENEKLLCNAPLWQQVFDWFNEQGLEGSVYSTASGYGWCIDKSAHNPKENISGGTSICDSDYEGPNPGGCWETKEEARLALVRKLIQTLKESKK